MHFTPLFVNADAQIYGGECAPGQRKKSYEWARANNKITTAAYVSLLLAEEIPTLSKAVNFIPVEAKRLLHSHVEVTTFREEIRFWCTQIRLI